MTTPPVSASASPPDIVMHHFLRGGHLRHVAAAAVSAGPPHVDAVRVDPRIGGAPAVDVGGTRPASIPPMPPESVFEFPMTPTPPVADMPGIRFWMPMTLREDGIAEMMSRSMICCVRALCTSTIGVSPVTVIVSSTVPTLSSAFTVATKVPDSSMPSRFTALNPGSVEGHGIGARPKIDDAVLAGVVGDDRPDLFNQDGAGGFHRHARQDAARRVPDDAGDGRLCIGRRGQEQRTPIRPGRTPRIAESGSASLSSSPVVQVDDAGVGCANSSEAAGYRRRPRMSSEWLSFSASLRRSAVPDDEIEDVFAGAAGAGIERPRGFDRANRDRRQLRG